MIYKSDQSLMIFPFEAENYETNYGGSYSSDLMSQDLRKWMLNYFRIKYKNVLKIKREDAIKN